MCLTGYPPAVALLERASLGAFQYFAPDSFYYLAIADHSREAEWFTFDRAHPTNGFHPLWLLILHYAFRLLDLDGPGQIQFTALCGIALTSIGTGLFSVAVHRLTGRAAIALLAAVPGFFYLAIPYFGLFFGSQWSFVNGMESPLSVLFFGLLAMWIFREGRETRALAGRDLIILSGLLTLSILSRLDDVFVLVPFVLLLATTDASRGDRLRRLVRLCVLPAAVIAGYLIYNYAYAGSFLPTSGATKSQPLHALVRNGYAVLTTFAPYLDFMRDGPNVWSSEAWRVLQMLVPAAIAMLWLWRRGLPFGARPEPLAPWITSTSCLATYVVIKAGYNFAMVGLWHQGSWYFVVSIMITNLLIAVWLSDLWDSLGAGKAAPLETRWPTRLRAIVPTLASLMIVIFLAGYGVNEKEEGGFHRLAHAFWSERRATETLIATHCPGCGVISFDDGIISYSLENTSTFSGFGLASDREAERARAEGRLLDTAWERGHRLIASVNYPLSEAAYERPEQLALELAASPHLRREDLSSWQFNVAFETSATRVRFIRFAPRESLEVLP